MKNCKFLFLCLLVIVLLLCGCGKNLDKKTEEKSTSNVWHKQYYKDEFGDATKNFFITNTLIKGTFSNSATTNSECLFQFIIDPIIKDISIGVFEYGDLRIKGEGKYEITIRGYDENNEAKDMKCDGRLVKDRISLYGGVELYGKKGYFIPYRHFITLMNSEDTNKEYKCYIKEKKDYGVPSTYNFSFKVNNFNEIMSELEKFTNSGIEEITDLGIDIDSSTMDEIQERIKEIKNGKEVELSDELKEKIMAKEFSELEKIKNRFESITSAVKEIK